MIPVDQEILQGLTPGTRAGSGQRPGDCLRACVASVLELPLHEVPHFVEEHDVRWLEGIDEFLEHRFAGAIELRCTRVVWPAVRAGADGVVPPVMRQVIASGPSPRGSWLHAVVVDAVTGGLVHDPHPSRQGLAGPPVDLLVLVPV